VTFVGPVDPDCPPYAFDLRGTVQTPRRLRDLDKVRYIVNHRLGGPGFPVVAEELIEYLAPTWKKYVGEAACPYNFLIEPTGRVVMVHALQYAPSHAGKYDKNGKPDGSYNKSGMPIGWIGDFRKAAPTVMARLMGLRLNQWCMDRFELGVLGIYGHDELPGASPGKVCPGPLLDMHAFRADLQAGRGIA
jgi:hypothetical protein